MSHGHPLTPGKHWRAQMGEAQKRLEKEDAAITAAGGNPAEGTIARLRSQLKRLDPRDNQYREVAQAISDEYARLYPGVQEEDQ